MLALLRHPAEMAELRDDPSIIKTAVEELLRYDSPVQLDARTALEDVEIAGVIIPKKEQPILLLAAANRDPAQFADPDRLDLRRAPNAHIAFSSGIHFCVGASLARAEGQVAINTMLRRMPKLDTGRGQPGVQGQRHAARVGDAARHVLITIAYGPRTRPGRRPLPARRRRAAPGRRGHPRWLLAGPLRPRLHRTDCRRPSPAAATRRGISSSAAWARPWPTAATP